MISFRKQGKSRRNARASAALEHVLRLFADPVRRGLKVRTGVHAGGLDPVNHNRRLLAVGGGSR